MLTVGKLKELLNGLDDDLPIIIENAYNEQFNLRSNDVTVEDVFELDGKTTVVIYIGNY